MIDLAQAIRYCEQGRKITCNAFPPGSYLHCNEEGDLWLTLNDEGEGHLFYIKGNFHQYLEYHLVEESKDNDN